MTRADLIAKLEAATEGSRELDDEIDRLHNPGAWSKSWTGRWCYASPDHVVPHYTTSLDAAMTLVPEDYFIELRRFSDGWYCQVSLHSLSNTQTISQKPAALALCIAALKAMEDMTRVEFIPVSEDGETISHFILSSRPEGDRRQDMTARKKPRMKPMIAYLPVCKSDGDPGQLCEIRLLRKDAADLLKNSYYWSEDWRIARVRITEIHGRSK